jgi:O-antigen/teichoic acid export membrane protein
MSWLGPANHGGDQARPLMAEKGVSRSGNIRRFVVGGAITSFVAIVSVKALGLIESIAVGRIVGNAQFGTLAFVLSVTNLVLAVGTLGLPAALTKFLSGEAASRQGARETIRIALRIVAVASTTVGGGCGILSVLFLAPSYQEAGLTFLLVFGIFLVSISAPLALFGSALQGLGRVTTLNLLTVLASVIGLAMALPLALVLGAPGALIALLTGNTLVGVLAIPAVRRSIRGLESSPDASGVPLRRLVDYGLPTVSSGFVVLMALYWVNSLMALGLGFADLGAFAVALTLANAIALLPSVVAVPLVPILSSLSVSDPEQGKIVVSKALRVIVFVSVPLVLIGMCFAPELIGVTYGPEFLRGSSLLSILSVSSLLAAISGIIGNQIAGTGRMWWSLAINLGWSGTVILTSSILIPLFGGTGASAALVAGYLVLTTTALAVGKYVLRISFDGLTRPAIWGFLLVVPALQISSLDDEWRILAGVMLLSLALGSLALLLNAGERALLKELPSILGTKGKAL